MGDDCGTESQVAAQKQGEPTIKRRDATPSEREVAAVGDSEIETSGSIDIDVLDESGSIVTDSSTAVASASDDLDSAISPIVYQAEVIVSPTEAPSTHPSARLSEKQTVERVTNAIMGDMLGQTFAPEPALTPSVVLQLEEQDASLNLSDVSGELLHTEPFGVGSAPEPGGVDLDGVEMSEHDDSMNLSEVSGTIHVEDFVGDE